jgi:hypothetical protein
MNSTPAGELLVPAQVIVDIPITSDFADADRPATTTREPLAVGEEKPGMLSALGSRIWSLAVGVWGAISLIVGLAILATIPILNLLSLGYLLEASGRVARTRRISAGFIGLRPAAVLGALVFAVWLLRWPVILVADLWYASQLIDPASRATKSWGLAWLAMSAGLALLMVAGPLVFALVRPSAYAAARDELWRLATCRLPYYFSLGLRGFVGAMIWLVLPISILACGAYVAPGPGALISLLGGLLLVPVLIYLPFLQTHFAAENRLSAMFEVGTVRSMFRRAPIAFWTALWATLLLALPLYLLMIEALPREVTWLPSVVFVMFLFPARLLTGWAYARAAKRDRPRFFLSRWLARLGMLPVALTYAFFVWLSQYLLWYGVFSLYHQHAFLVPVPFFGG